MTGYKKRIHEWIRWFIDNEIQFSEKHIDEFFSYCSSERIINNKKRWFSLAIDEYFYVKQHLSKSNSPIRVAVFFPLGDGEKSTVSIEDNIEVLIIRGEVPPVIILSTDSLINYYDYNLLLLIQLPNKNERFFLSGFTTNEGDALKGILMTDNE